MNRKGPLRVVLAAIAVCGLSGAVTKDQIVATIQTGPCADGKCGPNGCCPK